MGDRPTLADVARLAGVSVPTVSKVVRGGTDVSATTRNRVQEAMRTAGYTFRDRYERRSGGTIDLVIDGLDSLWALEVIRGTEEAAAQYGLSVAVIRNAEGRDVWSLAGEILRLAEATRTGKATRDELQGSTITISSLGPWGGIASTPVINRPEVAILAVNKVRETPVVVDGELEVRKMMNLSISCDHRVVDGWDAALFMQALKDLIEDPLRLLSMR